MDEDERRPRRFPWLQPVDVDDLLAGFINAVDDPSLGRGAFGRLCLVVGTTLDLLGALWMRRIVRSEP